MEKYATVIVGGGAAGICAAISNTRAGGSVVICEKMSQLGKKILATGNGRCNLLNDNFNELCYNAAARDLVKSIFQKFGKTEVLRFFSSLGLETYSQEGRIFPITNQASSVLKVLEMEVRRLRIPVEYNFFCNEISIAKSGIIVSSKNGKRISCRKAIITCGGKTYPALGADGSIYEIICQLGHTLIEPVPSVVPLIVKDSLCQVLQGQKIFAGVRSMIDGRKSEEVRGELLFTKYGLSGSCILDISEEISIAINRHHKKDVFVAVDLIPFLSHEQLALRLENRKELHTVPEDMLVGILPNKLCVALKGIFEKGNINLTVSALKDTRFKVSGTRSWNEAEFTAGGIDVNEVIPGTLESKLHRGIYFAGELLDVNGKRGGYNLGWAWASGYIAGLTF